MNSSGALISALGLSWCSPIPGLSEMTLKNLLKNALNNKRDEIYSEDRI
jgi:hypothetical protein